MKTLGEIYQLSVQFLEQKKTVRPKFLVQEILRYALSLDKVSLYMNFERPMENSELEQVRTLLSVAAKGKPIEQIIGKVDFFGCEIEVTPDVLIPRQETEILIDIVSKEVSTGPLEVWDICTGSGCLGISFKKKFPVSKVTLSDISSKALDVAKRNAKKNDVVVEFLEGDLLTPYQGKKADLILCNPPYISKAEFADLDASVKDYEPALALVGGERGTEFYEKMALTLPDYLNPGAKIYFEIGYLQGKMLSELFSGPFWKQKKVLKDWAGHDRFFFLEIE